MNDDGTSLDEKLQTLKDRANDIESFISTLSTLKEKLEKKKAWIKDIIAKRIQDNIKELHKWQELLYIIVDESLDEKIDKLSSQSFYFKTTHNEIKEVLDANNQTPSLGDNLDGNESEDDEDQDPKLDDLLALELDLQPDGLSQTEATEMESRVKNDFNMLLGEPKKSLRRTFTYVGGIIRGYLRRGKSNINWIKVMRKLEGREFEENTNLGEPDPYVGTKLPSPKEDISQEVEENVSNTWNSMTKLFENRHNQQAREAFCQELYKYYDRKPQDVEFYLPQLSYLLLNQYNEFQPLRKFILDKCRQSYHFALQTFLLVRASKDSREPPKKKKTIPPSIIKWRVLCNQFMAEIQNAITQGNKDSEEEHRDLFQYPVQFMDALVGITKKLSTLPSNQYSSELQRMLGEQAEVLASLPSSAFVYIPLLKPSGSNMLHHVIRIPEKESFPIPTYGRVLFKFIVEVVDSKSPLDTQKEERKKHKKKKKEKEREREREREAKRTEEIDKEKERDKSDESPKKEKSKLEVEREAKVKEIKNLETQIKAIESGITTSERIDIPPSPVKQTEEKDEEAAERKRRKREKREKRERQREREEEDFKPGSPSHSLLNNVYHEHGPVLVHSTHPIRNLGTHAAFGEMWDKQARRIKSESPHGSTSQWRMQPLIVKSGEEVLQEEFAMQLIIQFQRIFAETNVPVEVLPYKILATSSKAGFIEPIPNSLSLDKLKKQHTNLLNFFVQTFGEPSEQSFKLAQQNFVQTLAAYSIICYLLQIKDRHNGNILLDASGHLIHIDFGYLLSKTVNFEKAPFKLTTEFVEVMGGYKSPCYKEYCRLCVKSYLAARKHYKKIMLLVEMTIEGKGKKVLPCLQGGQQTLLDLENRFHLDWSKEECEKFVLDLIEEARGSWRTIVYDAYQLILNNIH